MSGHRPNTIVINRVLCDYFGLGCSKMKGQSQFTDKVYSSAQVFYDRTIIKQKNSWFSAFMGSHKFLKGDKWPTALSIAHT